MTSTHASAAADAYAAAVVSEMRRTRTSVPPSLRDAFTARYVIALTIVAVLTIASGVFGVWVVGAQESTAAVVNVAGKQRMLSQRIALQGAAIAQTPADERTEMRSSYLSDIDEMADAQTALIDGDPARGLPGDPSDAVRLLFDSGTADAVDEFLASARVVADPSSTEAAVQVAASSMTAAAIDGRLLERLDAIVTQFERDAADEIEAIADWEILAVALTLGILVLEAIYVFRPMSRRIRRETRALAEAAARHAAEAQRHAFGLQLRDAVELADSETDLVEVIHRAIEASDVDGSVDVLLTDPDAPNALASVSPSLSCACSVTSVEECPALRRNRTMVLSDPDDLAGCRRFRQDCEDADERRATTCVPLTFLGRSIGVVRAIGPVDTEPDERQLELVETVARNAGNHVGTLRALEQTRSDAERDPLTGLLNRRGLEQAVAQLAADSTPYVVIAVDLDHFKAVNDTHGHEVGDAVLVETATVLTSSTRPGDIVARHGGEEFVVVAPLRTDLDPDDPDAPAPLAVGAAVAERIREALARRVATADRPICTGSFGVAGPVTHDFEVGLRDADAALYRAKQRGRNRVEVDGDAGGRLDELIRLGGTSYAGSGE